MAFKFFVILALAALAAAGPLDFHHHHEDEHHAPAHYEFKYDVHDSHTGDIKSQHETRHDDKVEGHYTLVEPDGHRRTVHYTANDHDGFNAKVDREYVGGEQHHIPRIAPKYPSFHDDHDIRSKIIYN
ncbi:cuticle protein 7-like [Culicoides brevitarsis]|uniref:cuticle protein 7-like n=1 Tax=Culicoides brevitarsis TaxID=469753 RepID=UPI00307BB741